MGSRIPVFLRDIARGISDGTAVDWTAVKGSIGFVPLVDALRRIESLSRAFGRARSETARMPESIGSYRVLSALGEGGMGIVYLAEQIAPIQRQVALKVIKPGLDSRKVIERFQSERQVLAVLNHPHIARVFEAGTTEAGHPYFVMEYVPGEPITVFCRRHHLGIEARVQLVIHAAEAIHHAHQRAILHRDIKPTNVLVSMEGGKPLVKVIDFGIAKTLAREGGEGTLFTEQGQLIGTPEYMSPERLVGGQSDDVRGDVYSLGALLYRLLTGQLPLEFPERPSWPGARFLERFGDPEPPSARIRHGGSQAAQFARECGREAKDLVRALRGELDWIVMTAIATDRDRRYQSAQGLADDLRNHLENRPVAAGPPGVVYRSRKFLRRNRTASLAVLGFALALATVAGVLVSGHRQSQAVQRAKMEAELANQVSEYFTNLLFEKSLQGTDFSTKDILLSGAGRIRDLFADRPLVRAELAVTFGWALRSMQAYEEAEKLLLEARSATIEALGEESTALGRMNYRLGVLAFDRHRYQEAEAHLLEVLTAGERYEGNERSYLFNSLAGLGAVYRHLGRTRTARSCYREAIDYGTRILGPDHIGLTTPMTGLANLHRDLGEYDQAEELYLRVLDITNAEHSVMSEPKVAHAACWVNRSLAYMERVSGNYEAALETYEKVLRMQEELTDSTHVERMITAMHMALMMTSLRRDSEAEAWKQRALAAFRDREEPEPRFPYLLARYHALRGEREPALCSLRSAVAGGFGRHLMDRDPDLASLENEPAFTALLP